MNLRHINAHRQIIYRHTGKKIQRELSGEAAGLEELLRREDRDGVALVFLMQDGPGKRKFYEQISVTRYPSFKSSIALVSRLYCKS